MINWVFLRFFKERSKDMLTDQAYSGYAAMRLAFLEENAPALLEGMREAGTLDAHLEETEKLVNERRAQLEEVYRVQAGADEEQKARDWGAWHTAAMAAQMKARSQAVKEVVEAL